MSVLVWVGVAFLGGVGACARFLLDVTVASRSPWDFPLGTFVVNISGAFVLGFLSGIALEGNAELLAGTATIGSYTTFSTWMLETHRLGEDGEGTLMALNVVAGLAVGIGAAALGRAIGGAL
ncbi:MAG TPA: fluoride efflux transporter CrcB [Solirubrobacterales bacterium]|nr:fluoride efflux transporter CrcB [Solirubrobacterales bacterium]